MRLSYRILKYLVITLLTLFILLSSSLYLFVKTETGSRYLLNFIPGLTVEGSQGTLSNGWTAKKLIWQDETIKVTVINPTLDWYASCLFKVNICIDKLTAEQINIDLTEEQEDSNKKQTTDSSITLPAINLPVSIYITQVSINKVNLNKQQLINDIELTNAFYQNSTVTFEKLTANYQGKAYADLQGNIQLTHHWPLQLQGKLQLDNLLQQPWSINVEATGELQKKLLINITSQGYLQAEINGSANVLNEKIPAQLNLIVNDFFPKNVPDLPHSLLIKQLKLNLQGDLQQGYALQSNASFAGNTAPVTLSILGLLTEQGLQLHPLKLNTTEQKLITINGQVAWQPELRADATINLQDFPWQELYPLESPLPVILQNLHATLNYQKDTYQTSIEAKLLGPAGNFSLTTEATGDLKQITLKNLQINTPDKGAITGQAKINFDPTIDWLADLNIKSINPNYWLAELSGLLNGTVHSEGSLINDDINTKTTVDIQGTLRNQKTIIKAQLLAKQQQWKIPELHMQVGNNQLQGHAELNKQLQAQIDLNLPTLHQIYPSLAGNLRGKINITGTLEKPQGNVNLTGQKLAYDQQRINQLQLTAELNQKQQATLQLQTNQINVADANLGNLTINGSGNLNKQQLSVNLTGGIVTLLTSISSQQDQKNNWNIAINQLKIHSYDQNWQTQQPITMKYSNNGSLTINPHCLQSQKATLCAIDQQKILPTPQISYKLANFPLQDLNPWFPKDFNWQGILSANITFKLPKQGPSGIIEISTDKGTFKLRDASDDSWHDFSYKTLSVTSNLTPNKITSNLKFASSSLGDIQAEVELNPLRKNKPIAGNFNIKEFNLKALQPFVPEIEQLTGKVHGQGTISGTLTKPYISGKIAINDGNLMGDLPITIEQFQFMALVEGEDLNIKGHWKSGKQGAGSIRGHLNWSEEDLDMDITVQGKHLPVVVMPYAELEANTHLKLHMKDNTLFLSGSVDLPKGEIKVRDLPPSTVKPSSDVIIVTNETNDPQHPPFQLNMDIKVSIGDDRVTFSGFGLTSNIKGHLNIGKNLLTQGEISLKDGQYRAYGQRLEIHRARMLFTGSLTDPILDIEAIRIVGDVTAGLRLTGLASQPTITIFSNPSMNQEQALSYIILGRPMSTGDNNMLAQAAVALGVYGGSSILGEVADKVGIKEFQIDTSTSGDATSVVASGKITNDLSIHYGVNIFNSMNTIMLRYQLTKRLYIEAASGASSSLDLFYKRSF